MDASPDTSVFERASASAQRIRALLPPALRHPRVGIVCGSGLGGLADTVHAAPLTRIPYADLPGFPRLTVEGHKGELVFGRSAYFYEGHSMETVTFATRVCKVLGVETLILTNACGGLNPEYAVGDIVLLNDHVNLAGFVGVHPLLGANADEFGVRFPPMSDAYDLDLRRRAHRLWSKVRLRGGRRLHEGVYAFAAGPSYETRAEARLLRSLGADVVGMSTVPEILVARHCGMQVLALSLVTNMVVLDSPPRGDDPQIQHLNRDELDNFLSRGRASHEEVLEASREAALDMQDLVQKLVSDVASK